MKVFTKKRVWRWRSVRVLLLAALGLAGALALPGQTNDTAARVRALEERLAHLESRLTRQMNELRWLQQLSDVAVVETARFTGPPPRSTNNPAPPPGSNEVVVSALTFLPRKASRAHKLPLVVLAHGEIHGNVASDEEAHVVRELVEQGYAVIAPDYRGSSGYGGDFWRQIDYGGLEVEDVEAARRWMLERHGEIDARRVGIIGWSHGGLIALMTVFAYPEHYRACYAGVPVSDLEDRIGRRGRIMSNYLPHRITWARPSPKRPRNTGGARPPGTPPSCTRRCSSTRTRMTRM